MLTLFHRPGAGRPGRVRWALEEAGLEYELRVLSDDECYGAEHRERQPLNRVPVLDDGEGTIFESAAILLHVADLSGERLTFPVGTHEHALVTQWVVFLSTEIEPPFIESVTTRDDDARVARAQKKLGKALGAVENALGGGEHLVGDRFTVADLAIVDGLRVMRAFVGMEHSPGLEAYAETHASRPARAVADELLAAT